MRDENTLYWIWLAERCGIASKDFGRLMTKYESPFDIYRLDDEETERIEGIGRALKNRLTDKSLDKAYATLKYCSQKKISIIGYSDKRYPARLREIEDPPVLLYVLGNLPDMNSRLCIGVVGTRKMSEYGCNSAYKIGYELSAANTVVVSGMAQGIDGISACGAIAAKGETVAVFGSGLSVVYPKEHIPLMKKIIENGAVVSEYPPTERPNGYNFPKRNRIISGLSQGVLVIEGISNSGALITAKKAISQGRELFAMPGNIDEINSAGPNALIKDGAIVTLGAEDILTHYDFLYHDYIDYRGLRKAMTDAVPLEKGLEICGVDDVYRNDPRYRPVKNHAALESYNKVKDENRSTSPKKEAEVEVRSAIAIAEADEVLASMDDNCRRVFYAMPLADAVTADSIAVDGIDVGDVITAFTLLEINGLVESLPGGTYIRK